ncbi:MAG TPA: DUF5054 domain-containing protein [Candidatus Sulfotelmatobacter sp.]|nr:DUF5054 domain-containing protein [Candidatus Sulfotelmatobacter sp.]
MRRRDFIGSLLGALASKALPLGARSPSAPQEPSVKRVLVMFKCHFDAGFIDTQRAVVQRYFTEFFPNAMALASQLRDTGSYRYVWTTGSWLLYEYLEQGTPSQRKQVEQAVERGDLAWHALPFTWQTELLEPSMITGAIAFSESLDRRFGRKTTGAKLTDVPGHTRGLIAPLAAKGVKFIDIGVNEASKVPEVPPLFVWRAPGGQKLVVMYHSGYGGIVHVPGSDVAVAIVVRDDNSGPHTTQEVRDVYTLLRTRFPDAQIVPTSLTEIANAIEPFCDKLPVITQEIGDTWIHGIASDPLKIARFREVARLREQWLAEKRFAIGDATDMAMLRHILLEVEHTWGTDTKTWLDFDHYTPIDLASMLRTKNYEVVQFSWQEKRQDLFSGVAALPENLRQHATKAVQELNASVPNAGRSKAISPGRDIETAHFIITVDPTTAAISRLFSKRWNREWASNENLLALFSYQTLSDKDYATFLNSYVISNEDWAKKDFGKPNIERFGAESRKWLPSLKELRHAESSEGQRLLVSLGIDDPVAVESGRAAFPRTMYVEIFLPNATPKIALTFSWFEKPATRLPEALWLSFRPIAPLAENWILEKSGAQVSPFDVLGNGNRHMHSLSRGFSYKDRHGEFLVETLDAPLVALGVQSPLCFSNLQPDISAGIHCNLFNNAWGTNYIMWYGGDVRFRFAFEA